MTLLKITCLILPLFGLTLAEIDIQENLKKLNINGLPNNIDFSNITSAINPEDVEQLLRDKCRANSGSDEAYEKAKEAVGTAQECVKNIVDPEIVQDEIEKAKPTGDLDLVFKKYCQQAPTLKKCIFDLTTAYEPCLEAAEVETKNTAINVTDSLVDFICHKDGDRIALFIAEGGPECLNASAPGIKSCVEKHFNLSVGADDVPTLESLPLLLLKTEECEKFLRLQKCVVDVMEDCKETTPGNVVESLFNFIKKHTPCRTYVLPELRKNGGSRMFAESVLSIVVGFLVSRW